MTSAQMQEWSVEAVQQWFRSLDPGGAEYGVAVTEHVVEACAAKEITGKKLKAYKNYKQIATALGIVNGTARLYYAALGKKRMEIIRNQTNKSAQNTSSAGEFELNIKAEGKRKPLLTKVTVSTTILVVKELYYNQEIAPILAKDPSLEEKLKSIVFIFGGKPLKPEKTLGYYKIISSRNILSVRFGASGGTFADSDDIYRARTVNTKKFPRVVCSTAKDCITLEGDEGGFDRAAMPCGHAIAPITMFSYISSIFCSSNKAVKIICPVPKCEKEWDWQLCTEVADMTSDEYFEWTAHRDKRLNALRDEKKCPHPHCRALCVRNPGVIIFRMRCNQCSNSDWCWECGKPWNHSGLMICGNSACTVVTSLNQQLRCKTIQEAINLKVGDVEKHKPLPDCYSFLLSCPVARACPNCMTVIYHVEACKHMKCIGCSKEFCWYCLAIMDPSKGWPCGSAGTKCNPQKHPVQRFS